MKAEIAYKGGPYAVEEALELIKALALRARRAASKSGKVATTRHRQMVPERTARLEPKARL